MSTITSCSDRRTIERWKDTYIYCDGNTCRTVNHFFSCLDLDSAKGRSGKAALTKQVEDFCETMKEFVDRGR